MKIALIIGAQLFISVIALSFSLIAAIAFDLDQSSSILLASIISTISAGCLMVRYKEVLNV